MLTPDRAVAACADTAAAPVATEGLVAPDNAVEDTAASATGGVAAAEPAALLCHVEHLLIHHTSTHTNTHAHCDLHVNTDKCICKTHRHRHTHTRTPTHTHTHTNDRTHADMYRLIFIRASDT